MQSWITELDPPRKLAVAWNGSGDVSLELEPKGNEVLLTVIHRRLPNRPTMLMIGAGWHMHLDILVARATGKEPEPFWDGWSRLRKEYDRRIQPDGTLWRLACASRHASTALHAFGRQLPIRGRLFIDFLVEKLVGLDL